MSQSFPFLLLTPRNMGLFVYARVLVDVLFLSIFPNVDVYIRSACDLENAVKRHTFLYTLFSSCTLLYCWTKACACLLYYIIYYLLYYYAGTFDKVTVKRRELSQNSGIPMQYYS